VEHPVTEAVLGIDLVEWMVRQAAGEDPIPATLPQPQGHAIEARLYAEQPHAGFRPSAGRLTDVAFPQGIRVDGWIATGTVVEPFYDPMLAKIIVHGANRPAAIRALQDALAASRVAGIATNLDYLSAIAGSEMFAAGDVTTAALNSFSFAPTGIEVLAPGAQTSLQELPGRLGLWHVGVPPSGPMDARGHRNANRLVGNPPDTAALELTMSGPSLRFLSPARVGLAGARIPMVLDGASVTGPVVDVPAGGVLALGAIEGPGMRAYLAVAGGFAAPEILGSRATFGLGGFGGHGVGTLRTGDLLPMAAGPVTPPAPLETADLTHDWTLNVVYGPHGAPDFFAPEDIETLFTAPYEVHFNSDRTGGRLVGPAPKWARADGGEAGLHPSNLHDNAYAIGAIDFTGDMPILLGPDGPSLGGFVCPGVVAADDLWKLGQLRPGDTVRFVPVTRLADPVAGPAYQRAGSPVVWQGGQGVSVAYRRQGDANLLVEYGPMTLDITLRLRVHLLMQAVAASGLPLLDLTPGIRSLQIHYDPARLSRLELITELQRIEAELPDAGSVKVPSRIVHMPLSWNDPQAELAMRKYQDRVRPDAPWCPSNIEFIRRINGLADEAAVQRTISDARYLVLGLGDVYLGAPVATPIDPRHRLVTTKYNPARTWTPENAVGIGGAYMCIYGMEGPGGYQLFGRTIQVWNTWNRTPAFHNRPWLLDFFDQIRFHLVSPEDLAEARTAFPHGAYPLRIEETVFDWAAEEATLAREGDSIIAAKTRQQAAFEAERMRWKDAGLDSFTPFEQRAGSPTDLPPGCTGVESPVPGSVWKFMADLGARVMAGDTVAIIESMKMEIAVTAPISGRLLSVNTSPGRIVRAGEILAVMESE
ncbi:MAG: 5-oxoprolinase/urea amidolyase family protein, partial [Paracoccaceae bacterium]